MSVYQTLKRVVPLAWKVAFHEYKVLPMHYATRVTNRLGGEPPIPPPDLIYLVAGHRNPRKFLDSGRSANAAIRRLLHKHRLKVEQFEAILDFGCGVGRIMRHWRTTTGPAWHGTDYNPTLVAWCKGHLPFAEFRVNPLAGGLPYEPDAFDFIYAFSVFTHLSLELQYFWINELKRVLKPGGYLWLSTHGAHYLPILTGDEVTQFERGELVVREENQSGSNVCAVFHPASYLHGTIAQDFTVIDFVPGSQQGDFLQDVHLLRKPLAAGPACGA